MRKINTIAAFLISFACAAQHTFVPYRVGDKFGIGDTLGKMTVNATYDFIEPVSWQNQIYAAFTKNKGKITADLIVKNKVVLKNTKYKAFHYEYGLIKAYDYIKNSDPTTGYDTRSKLYTSAGTLILNREGDSYIYNVTDYDRDQLELLIANVDLNEKFSLHVFDIKLNKITKTILKNSTYHFRDDMVTGRSQGISVVFADSMNKLKSVTIVYENKRLKSTFGPAPELRDETIAHDGWLTAEAGMDEIKHKNWQLSDSTDFQIRTVETVNNFVYEERRPEKTSMRLTSLEELKLGIVTVNGRKGLKNLKYQLWLINPEYDEILKVDGGFITRKGNNYGLYAYSAPDPIIVPAVFENLLPIPENTYDSKGTAPIIKLFDNEGKFTCYASVSGRLFYVKK